MSGPFKPMNPDDLNLIQIELDRHTGTEVAPSQLAHQIETIAAASRTLETALLRERHYSKQLREYVNQIILRMNYFQKQEKEAAEKLSELQSNRDQNSKQVQELTAELQKVRNELAQYRNAWGQILAREKHAQYILSRGDASAKRIQELELALTTLEKRVQAEKTGREKAESHASSYRQELQTTLVRLHSSEARYNDMARELEAIHTLRKNHALELSRAEQVAREKLESQFSREREQILSDFAREREQLLAEIARERSEFARNRAELEKFRAESERAKERLRREMESQFQQEIDRLKAQVEAQSQLEQKQVSDMLRGEIAKLESIIRTLGDEAKTLRNELSEARLETSNIEQTSRQVELDLLRSREEVGSLQKQLIEERTRKASLEQSLQAAEKSAEKLTEKVRIEADQSSTEIEQLKGEIEKYQAAHKAEIEEQRERSVRYSQDLCELIQSDRKQLLKMVEGLIDAWGSEDEALTSALESLRDACEVKTVRTEAPPAKLEIVTSGGSRLNC